MFIVECLTDNVNRTISEVRNCFTKTGGKLGISGSVVHQFNHQAVFAMKDITEDEVLEILVEHDLDVSDIESDDEGVTIYSDATNFNAIRTAFNEAKPDLDYDTEEIMWLPIMEATLDNEEDQEKFERLTNMLDELDDVQDVYHNVSL
jgi:transcriptional/translational regulatory protein YebC/TACO1